MRLEDYATVEEAIAKTGYSKVHLRRLLKDGKIDAVKMGNLWLISRASLESYVANAEAKREEDHRYGPKD